MPAQSVIVSISWPRMLATVLFCTAWLVLLSRQADLSVPGLIGMVFTAALIGLFAPGNALAIFAGMVLGCAASYCSVMLTTHYQGSLVPAILLLGPLIVPGFVVHEANEFLWVLFWCGPLLYGIYASILSTGQRGGKGMRTLLLVFGLQYGCAALAYFGIGETPESIELRQLWDKMRVASVMTITVLLISHLGALFLAFKRVPADTEAMPQVAP